MAINGKIRIKSEKALRMKYDEIDRFYIEHGERGKICVCCLQKRPLSMFPKHNQSKDGYMHMCKECRELMSVTGDSRGRTGVDVND